MTHFPIEGIVRARIRMGLYGEVRPVRHASCFRQRPTISLLRASWEGG